MSLEQAIADNTKAVAEQNTLLAQLIALQSGGAAASASSASGEKSSTKGTSTKGTGAKGAGSKAGGKNQVEVIDPDTLKAKLVEFKNLTDLDTAKALTKKLGYGAIADVPDEKSKEVYDAINAAIIALDDGNSADVENEEESL